MSTAYLFRPSLVVLSASLLALPIAAHAQSEINIPVLVPVTGFLALEGTSATAPCWRLKMHQPRSRSNLK